MNKKISFSFSLYYYLAILTISFMVCSCEKDDICSETPITPQLIINFKNIEDNNLKKNVPGLQVRLTSDNRIVPNLASLDSIAIPLDINNDNVSFILTKNFGAADQSIICIDTLSLSYNRTNKFVNKACGFKTLFNGLSNEMKRTTNNDNNWIEKVNILKSTVNDETGAHISIFH